MIIFDIQFLQESSKLALRLKQKILPGRKQQPNQKYKHILPKRFQTINYTSPRLIKVPIITKTILSVLVNKLSRISPKEERS